MGSLNYLALKLALSAKQFDSWLLINVTIKNENFSWKRPGQESNPGRRGEEREGYLCAFIKMVRSCFMAVIIVSPNFQQLKLD
jgi:hypothetical protein